MVLSTSAPPFPPASVNEPNDSDWQDFCDWATEQDAIQADLDALPEPTPEEWSEHVKAYLAKHGLTEVPF
jgi:hypothetical protein